MWLNVFLLEGSSNSTEVCKTICLMAQALDSHDAKLLKWPKCLEMIKPIMRKEMTISHQPAMK